MSHPHEPAPEISGLKQGSHLCMVYDSEEEHAALLAPFLRAGVERGEKVVYLADYTSGGVLMAKLRKAGFDVSPYVRSGQFSILSAVQTYLPQGAFDPDAMIAFLEKTTKRAVAEGYAGLRATAEMTWVLEGRPGCERILDYETKVNRFFGSDCRALAICQYRRPRFDPKMLLEILKIHPVAAAGAELCPNPFYIPPELYLSPREPDAMLDRCLAVLRARENRPMALSR